MPTISRFFGIVIRMYYEDHAPPHFHAYYSGAHATLAIDTLEVLSGDLPKRAVALILEWAMMQRRGLRKNWDLASRHEQLKQLPPLT